MTGLKEVLLKQQQQHQRILPHLKHLLENGDTRTKSEKECDREKEKTAANDSSQLITLTVIVLGCT